MTPDEGGRLTTRERQVLELAAGGKTTGDIARELIVSPHTVVTHRRSLFSKLGATTMPQAVAVAFRQGLLT